MYKLIQFIQNQKGDALTIGAVAVIDRETSARVPIYSDEGGTPIADNLALPDTVNKGLIALYVDDGIYHVDVFKDRAATQYAYRLTDYPMVATLVVQLDAALAAQAAAETARDQTEDLKSDTEAAAATAVSARDDAMGAAASVQALSNRFDDTAAGISGTSNGDLFNVLESGNIVEYENVAGVATATGFELPGAAFITSALAQLNSLAQDFTDSELTAIRKSTALVERNRLAALTGSMTRFVSVSGSDLETGRAMARAKGTVAGLLASFDYGVSNVTAGGTLTGGNGGTYRIGVSGGTAYRTPNIEMRVTSAGVISSGQNGWTRAIDGGDYAAGSAVPTLSIPASANLPSATLTATLGRVASPRSVIGFEHGSRFVEQMVVTIPGVTVASFPKGGKSRLPLFDCTDAIPLWTLDSGNVWSAVIGRAADYEPVGGEDNYSLFQDTSPTDDMGANYRWMTRVASKANCNATPDSYYIVSNTYAETSATTTVYVHAAGSVDPNTLKYRYNRRTQGVFGKDRLPNFTVEGISCVGPLSAQGSVNAGTNFTFRRACLANGGKHDVVFESGLLEDIVSFNTELVSNRAIAGTGGLDCIQMTSYRDNPVGLSTTLRRCGAIQPSGVWNAGWFYSHASGPNIYDEILLESCFSNNGGGIKGAYAKRQLFRGMYQKDLRGAASTPTAMASAMAADPTLTSYFEQTHGLYTADAALGSVSSATALTTGIDSGGEVWPDNRTEQVIRHNGYYNNHDQVLGQGFANITQSAIQKVDFSHNTAYLKGRYTAIQGTEPLGSGSAGIHHNILVRNFANIGSFVQWVQLGASFTGTIDWNVYVDLQANANLRWRKGATSYTFANWQALGFDTNSVVLNAAQADDLFLNGVAGIASGDFRLDPACTLKFADGTTPLVGNAGIQEYYDWNARQYVTGQPLRFPTIPTSWAECQAYAFNPTGWNFYP